MPTCVVATSIPKSGIPAEFMKETSALIAKILGKPESYVTVRVEPDQMMIHGGSDAPCASIMLYSIHLGRKGNKDFSAKIADHMETKLGVGADRFYITFVDVHPQDCGYNKGTF